MHDPVLYRQANEDAQARYLAEEGLLELLSIRTFLDDINRGYIKDIKHAQENFRVLKENVTSKALKEIVKELEKAIFGPDDKDTIDTIDTIDTDKNENYEESIGERVKLKNQEKLNKKNFEENYATGYDDLDKIGSIVFNKKYGANNEDRVFGGFKKAIDNYEKGIISKKDLYNKYIEISNNTNLYDIYSKNNKLISSGFKEILFFISSSIAKFDEKKILDGIKDTNKNLYNKEYVTKNKKGEIIPIKYRGLLNKYINIYKKNPPKLRINEVDAKIHNTYDGLELFNKGGVDDEEDLKMKERTLELFHGLNKIRNLVKNIIYDIDTQEYSDEFIYDREGFNKMGYDRDGYDRDGFNREGISCQGLSIEEIEQFMQQKNQRKGLKINS